MKNLKGVSLWMKAVVIVAALLWCSPVFAGDLVQDDGAGGVQPPSGILTTTGVPLTTEGGYIDTGGGYIGTEGGLIDTLGGDILMWGGDLDTEGGDVSANDVTATGTVSGGIVTGDIVQDSGGASMAGGVVTGTSVTDGVATLAGGDLSNVDEIFANTIYSGESNIMTMYSLDIYTDILNATDVNADGTVTVTDGADETVITGGTLGVMNANGGLLVDDTMAGMGYDGYSVVCDDSGAIMRDGTNSMGVDGTSAFMTDGTASVSTSGGTASMTDGTYNVTLDGTSATMTDGTNGLTVDASGASMTDGTASVSTSGGTANMSSGGGDVTVTDTSASVTVYNGDATHGLVVGANQTSLSGGTDSTTLTLNDDEALLDNELNMDGNRITNVANGRHRYDAVNKGQLDEVAERAYQGIAAVAAMSAIPQPMSGHRFAIGIGGGTYKEEGAFAIGGSANLTNNIRLTGSVGITSDSAVGAAGVGFSW